MRVKCRAESVKLSVNLDYRTASLNGSPGWGSGLIGMLVTSLINFSKKAKKYV
jgi:hypothetical protein